MQMVSEVMTRNVQYVSPQENLQRAAQMMDELNVGSLPVCDGDRLVGMITDRDITIRGVAAGRAPGEVNVDEVMSGDVRCAFDDQSLEDVMVEMADSRVRRIPVLSHDQHKLVGIVSLGDVATRTPITQKEDVEDVLETVSSPSQPSRTSTAASDIAGRTGSGTAGAAATGTGSAGVAGTAVPKAGDSGGGSRGIGIDAAGASGAPDAEASDDKKTKGKTGDPRGNFGVSGQDLEGDGLPPS